MLRHILIAISLTGCGASLPQGVSGPEADAAAQRLLTAIDIEAWNRTGALAWTFAGRNEHLWDKERELIRVRFGDTEVQRHLWRNEGLATEAGQPVGDPDDLQELLDDAYAAWVNDAFWLNPLVKLFDPGVVRSVVVDEDGRKGLLMSFTQGGLTPGDSYLWLVGPDGLPEAWRMWVSIIPIGGVEITWERWQTLETGAKVSTLHDAGIIGLQLTGVRGATSAASLNGGQDPFAALLARYPLPTPAAAPAEPPAPSPVPAEAAAEAPPPPP